MLFRMQMGRRDALAAIASALAGCAAPRARRARRGSVIVVGAGAAGLAAASWLRDHGFEVIVLEARDRIGGRIHSLDGFARQPIELGAELIHGDGVASWPLARAAGLTTAPVATEAVVREGALIATEIEIDLSDLGEGLVALRQAPDRSVAQVLAEVGIPRTHPSVERAGIDVDLETQSAHAMAALLEDPDRTAGDHFVRGGYVRLLEAIVRGLDVRLGHAVSTVAVRPDGVVVEDTSGRALRADGAIVTLPLGVLKAGAVAFDPALPADVVRAIDALGVVDAVKLFYRFAGPVWPEGVDLVHVEGPGPRVFWSSSPARQGDEHVVCGWATHALARRLIEAGERAALELGHETLASSLPRPLPALLGARWSEWGSDPLARGAYSSTPVGAFGARAVLAATLHGRLRLAGEATGADGSERGAFTVHGAIESGWHAAQALAARLA
jgi:monoamine oxidase